MTSRNNKTKMMAQPMSPVTLNNKGVLLIEAGRFEDAARCFKKASKMMMAVISHQQSRRNMTGESIPNSNLPLQIPVATIPSIGPENDEGETPKEKGVPPPNQELCDSCDQPPRKRRRRSSMTSSFPVPSYTLGRPLWVQSKDKRQLPLDTASLSATLLYNLGLSFTMIASKKPKDQARAIYKRALELYKMSSHIMLRGPMSSAVQSPVVFVSLHNLIQLHKLMDEPEAAERYNGELANVLRLMGTSTGIGYEEFYIKFLSLPKADAIAAAA